MRYQLRTAICDLPYAYFFNKRVFLQKILYYNNENTRQQRLSVSLQKNDRLTLKEDSL